jgi:uncharacterized membrane protein (UPF0182 family)
VVNTFNSQGQLVSTNPARMAPLYQVMALPGSQTQAFTITEAFVPATQSNTAANGNLNLRAFMVGNSDPGHYGQITVYQTPQSTTGPANADSYMNQDGTVSKDITLLDQKGSEVLLGNTLMVPVGNAMVYLRPLYVASTTNPLPELTYVIGVVNKHVVIESTVSQTLSGLLNTSINTQSGGSTGGSGSGTGTGTGTLPTQVQQDLAAAQNDYNLAQKALTAGGAGALGTYQSDITAMETQINAAEQALKATETTTSPKTTTTTSPKAAKKAKTTSTSTSPTSTEPKSSATTTTLAAAAGKS